MYDITGVISLLNIWLSNLYSSLSATVILIASLDLVCLSVSETLCPSKERREEGIYSYWTLVRAQACDLEAVRSWYDNDIMAQKTGFLKIPRAGKQFF